MAKSLEDLLREPPGNRRLGQWLGEWLGEWLGQWQDPPDVLVAQIKASAFTVVLDTAELKGG